MKARRYTNNAIESHAEIDAVFDRCRGRVQRIRCGRCESDTQTTRAAAHQWFDSHACTLASVTAMPWWRDCPDCGERNYLQPPNGTPHWHFDDVCSACGGDPNKAMDAIRYRFRELAQAYVDLHRQWCLVLAQASTYTASCPCCGGELPEAVIDQHVDWLMRANGNSINGRKKTVRSAA